MNACEQEIEDFEGIGLVVEHVFAALVFQLEELTSDSRRLKDMQSA